MILINLLPHRELARKKQKEAFLTQLGAAVLVGGVIGGMIFTWYQARLDGQRDRNAFLVSEIAKLDVQIKEIASLQAELNSLKARQTAVEDLQADRNLPVHLLDEMVKQLPDGVYLNSLKQDNQTILLTGAAQSQERVSELLRNLGNNSPWLARPELVEIVAGNASVGGREQRRVSSFTVRVALTRAAPAAQAPGATAPPVAAGKT